MKLLCAFGGHEAGEIGAYAGGYHVSQCRHCGTAMIRHGGAWQDVPDGHAIVWRAGVRIEKAPDAQSVDRSETLRTNAAAPAALDVPSLPGFGASVGSRLGRLLGTRPANAPDPTTRLNRG